MKNVRRNKNGFLQYRISIPPPLRSKAGKAEKFWAMGTQDPNEANRLHSEFEERAAIYLASLGNETVLTPREIQSMVERWLSVELARDEEGHRLNDFMSYEDGEETPEVGGLDVHADLLLEEARDGDFSSIDRDAERLLDAKRIALPRDSNSWRRLQESMLLAKVKLLRIQHRRHMGEWKSNIAAPTMDQVENPTPTLREVRAAWMKQLDRSKTALNDSNQVCETFVKLHGNLQIHQIVRTQVAELRDYLLDDGKKSRAPATVKKLLGSLKALLKGQVNDGVIEINPADGVQVPFQRNAPKAREDFTVSELQAIFAAPVFVDGVRPAKAGGEASYWMFVLALFSGARLGELCYLDIDDVVSVDGTRFLHIHNVDDDKQIKTKSSRRVVPVHHRILALGFERYLESLGPSGRLFPDLKTIGKSSPSHRFSKWANELIDDVGIVSRKLPFYSLRHTFITGCRNAGIPEDIHQRFTGHINGNVGRTYGGIDDQKLREFIDQVQFNGLIIPQWEAGVVVERYKRPKPRK
tara:strand:+ start:71 stop:1645 length:1575 start_codon:yes stop_codon:yes gene_type:complete